MSLVRSVRSGTRRFPDASSAANSITDIQTSARLATNPRVVGDIFDNLTYTVDTRNRLNVNGVPLANVEVTLRRGQLRQFVRDVNSNAVVSASDERGFARTLVNVPDTNLRNLDETIASNRVRHPDLNVNANSGVELHASMTPATRTKFESAMRQLKAAGGVAIGGVVTIFGVIGLIVIGLDFYQSAVDATNNRLGCHLVRRSGNVLTSCRIINRSCGAVVSDTTNACGAGNGIPDGILYNTTLYLIQSIGTPEADILGPILTLSGPLTAENISVVLADVARFQIARERYETIAPLILNACITTPSVESGEMPFCRACVPSADVTSTTFIDTSDLADNMTFHCVTVGSILDTIVDIGIGIGVDVLRPFAGFSGSLSGDFRIIFIIILVIIFLILSIVLFGKLSKKKDN